MVRLSPLTRCFNPFLQFIVEQDDPFNNLHTRIISNLSHCMFDYSNPDFSCLILNRSESYELLRYPLPIFL